MTLQLFKREVFKISKNTIQSEAPLYQEVRNHLQKGYLSFHVPCHGGGAGAPPLLRRAFGSYLEWDLTELDALDDLHLPLRAIERARKLAAALFKAEETFFLVNGVTVGILAFFLAFCRAGDKVLLSRIAHKSALHGIMLAGARPFYFPVEREPVTGFPLNVSPASVEKALQEHPDARLLFITSPSYWGVTADLLSISKITDRYGVFLAVDEAHGAHLPFYPKLMPHSAAAKADLWLHSAHKTLGSLTPGAFLHLGDKHVPALKFWLQALQTSSPSYPLMISLDLCRCRAALRGKEIFSRSWKWAQRLRRELIKRGVVLLSAEMVNKQGFNLDPCRLTLLFPGGEGQRVAREMVRSHHLQVEMKDDEYILLITGPSHLSFSPASLADAINRSRDELFPSKRSWRGRDPFTAFSPSLFKGNKFSAGLKKGRSSSPAGLSPKEAFNSPSRTLPLQSSPGWICSEMVILSPPGLPVLFPGEIITEEVCAYLLKKRAGGKFFQGAADHTLQTIQVVAGTKA